MRVKRDCVRRPRAAAASHLAAEPKARKPQPNELSPLNVPAIIAPSLHTQQPMPAGVNDAQSLASFSVEQRLATDDVETDALEDKAARRLKTSRE
jgi:hypothetical protein